MLELRTKWNSFSTILESDTRPCVSLLLYILGYIIKLNEVLFTNVMFFLPSFIKRRDVMDAYLIHWRLFFPLVEKALENVIS